MENLVAEIDSLIKVRDEIISQWCAMKAINDGSPEISHEIDLLFSRSMDIDEHIKKLKERYYNLRDEKQAKKRENDRRLENTFIELECPDFKCKYSPKASILMIPILNYKYEQIHKCPVCGGNMKERHSKDIDIELYELGVKPSL